LSNIPDSLATKHERDVSIISLRSLHGSVFHIKWSEEVHRK